MQLSRGSELRVLFTQSRLRSCLPWRNLTPVPSVGFPQPHDIGPQAIELLRCQSVAAVYAKSHSVSKTRVENR